MAHMEEHDEQIDWTSHKLSGGQACNEHQQILDMLLRVCDVTWIMVRVIILGAKWRLRANYIIYNETLVADLSASMLV